MQVPTTEIVVGDRIRENALDGIKELSDSIAELGQLQPILIDREFNLIDGERRLRACEFLNRDVLVHVANNLDDAILQFKAQRHANTQKPFTPSELVKYGKRLEEIEKPKAEERKAATQAKPGSKVGDKGSSKLDAPSPAGRTDEKVADAVGVSKDTYRKAKSVVEAAADESLPEPVREVAKEAAKTMDATGKVDPAFKAVQAAKANAPAWSVTDDIAKFRTLFDKLEPKWSDADRSTMKQFFRQMANEV